MEINQGLIHYCEAHTTPLDEVLNELERETHLKTLSPNMLSGPFQGQLLRMISLMQRPEVILEIGTFTGYSAICLAQGLAEKGVLHTFDIDEEKTWMVRKFVEKAGLSDKIHLHIGDARELIPTLDVPPLDLVFIDADKDNYSLYFDLVIDRVRPGGLIIADNVLWKGKVLDSQPDKMTAFLQAFNDKVNADERVENLLLPVRDGLMIMRKSV